MSQVDTAKYQPWVPKAPPSDLFPFAYNLECVKSIDKLIELLSTPTNYMAFDTETTGLNAEKDDIVGYSFCLDGKSAYYVPVWHYNFSLGDKALDLIYNKMCNTKSVAMFNMRFDTRMMEYHGYTTLFKQIENNDSLTEEQKEEQKLKLSKKPFIKYDMTKVKTYDVQAVVYLADTNVKYPSLKASEEWYLGWRGASFEQTVMSAKNENAVVLKTDKETGTKQIKEMNFFYLDPEEAYEYAAVDALGTYLLGEKLMPYFVEAGVSGILDVNCLMPLTRFENELTLMDTEKLKTYKVKLENKIKEVQERCWSAAGYEFNLGSNKDCTKVLKELNIDTGVRTKRGQMSTSKEAIASCLETLRKANPKDPAIQFLTDLTNYGTYTKQKSSYIDNIIDMAESNKYHKNRLRFSYKTTEVPSGRLAAGGDKKNQFFAAANIQNITKPHVTNHFAIREELVAKYYPDIIEEINKSGTREEAVTHLYYIDQDRIKQYCINNNCIYNEPTEIDTRLSYRIYGWVISDKPWLIPNEDELIVEGFNQDLNIRSSFLPDDNYYWVSLDFNAEEIRIPALWSLEPAWVNAFKEGRDVHKATAVAIWGEENYNKDKRKKAKGANFGILYGMTAHNFAPRFNISLEEAQEFVDSFKKGLPRLTAWISYMEKIGEKQGYIKTMFGRPRRVKYWFDTKEWKWINFAKRTIVNSAVQGTGADILKIVMIKLFETFYGDTPQTKLTELVRFKNTIHDEINYQIYKDKEHNYLVFNEILKRIINIMRVQQPEWPFPMEVGLSIGNRWGQSVDFEFDKETLEVIQPKGDILTENDLVKSLNLVSSSEVEKESTDEENTLANISEEEIEENYGDFGDMW